MNENETILLTEEGYKELVDELNYLKLEKRNEVITALKEARALGDLSENAEYDAARNEQAKIKELEYKLEHCKVMDGKDNTKVNVGSTVTVCYVDDEEEEVYKIVGSLEADPFNNKISNESPIGAAIIGKAVGDVIEVSSPNGSYAIKIVKIA